MPNESNAEKIVISYLPYDYNGEPRMVFVAVKDGIIKFFESEEGGNIMPIALYYKYNKAKRQAIEALKSSPDFYIPASPAEAAQIQRLWR